MSSVSLASGTNTLADGESTTQSAVTAADAAIAQDASTFDALPPKVVSSCQRHLENLPFDMQDMVAKYLDGKSLLNLANTGKPGRGIVEKIIKSNLNDTYKQVASERLFWLRVIKNPEFNQHREGLQSEIKAINAKDIIFKRDESCKGVMRKFFTDNPTIAPSITSLDLNGKDLSATSSNLDKSFTCLRPEWFQVFPNLQKVDLRNTKIERIPNGTFRHNTLIQKVFIHNCSKPIMVGFTIGLAVTAIGFADCLINTESTERINKISLNSILLGSIAGVVVSLGRKINPEDSIRTIVAVAGSMFSCFYQEGKRNLKFLLPFSISIPYILSYLYKYMLVRDINAIDVICNTLAYFVPLSLILPELESEIAKIEANRVNKKLSIDSFETSLIWYKIRV